MSYIRSLKFRRMKKLMIALAVLLAGRVSAQNNQEKEKETKSPFFRTAFTAGAVIGENLTDTNGTPGIGIQGGIHSFMKINERLHFITGLHYYQLRSAYTFDRTLALPGPDGLLLTELQRTHQLLEVPFMVGTTIALGDRFRLNVGLGLGAGLLLSASDRLLYENVSPNGVDREVDQDISPKLRTALLLGRGLTGVTYKLSDQWAIGIEWSTGIGLTEISKVDAPGVPNLYFNTGGIVVTRSLN
jgi:hypothetical protein